MLFREGLLSTLILSDINCNSSWLITDFAYAQQLANQKELNSAMFSCSSICYGALFSQEQQAILSLLSSSEQYKSLQIVAASKRLQYFSGYIAFKYKECLIRIPSLFTFSTYPLSSYPCYPRRIFVYPLEICSSNKPFSPPLNIYCLSTNVAFQLRKQDSPSSPASELQGADNTPCSQILCHSGHHCLYRGQSIQTRMKLSRLTLVITIKNSCYKKNDKDYSSNFWQSQDFGSTENQSKTIAKPALDFIAVPFIFWCALNFRLL